MSTMPRLLMRSASHQMTSIRAMAKTATGHKALRNSPGILFRDLRQFFQRRQQDKKSQRGQKRRDDEPGDDAVQSRHSKLPEKIHRRLVKFAEQFGNGKTYGLGANQPF